jgi:hypothetical protein
MLGYYKEPELTKAAITEDGWLRTGDKGSVDAEGNLKITGRVKDLFKTSKGKYVAPAPIEDRLVMHASVEACCVTGANLGQPLGIVMLNMEAIARAKDPAARGELETSLGEHLEQVNATLDPHEQLDCLVALERRQRLHHADLQGQAQPNRRGVRTALRELGDLAQARGVVGLKRIAAALRPFADPQRGLHKRRSRSSRRRTTLGRPGKGRGAGRFARGSLSTTRAGPLPLDVNPVPNSQERRGRVPCMHAPDQGRR